MLKVGKLRTEIVAIGKRSGSTYIEFPDHPHMGKIRVGDHPERKCYGYRWQIRIDIRHNYIDQKKGHPRYFYSYEYLFEAVNHMFNYDRVARRRRHENS